MSHRADKFFRDDLDMEFSNRRRYPRVKATAESVYESPNRILFNDVEDLTLRGAFIRTFVPDPVGTEGKMRMVLPNCHEVITCRVEVVWSSAEYRKVKTEGMGVRFVGLTSGQMMRLADFLLERYGEDRALDYLGAVRGAA